MTSTIPYGRQEISDADIEAVVDVLRSDYLTQGPRVPEFENCVAEYSGAGYAVAANSATSALHIACLALGVGPGDVVWTSATTFVASSNCALYCGASVDFVDISPETFNMDITCLAEKLAIAEAGNRLPRVVIPVHLCGQPCDMAAIYELSQQYGFNIIEDASHAIGGRYKDKAVGNCEYSDITVFSFHPVKIVTTGEGGMALTNDAQLARRLRLFRSHGISSDAEDMQARPDSEIWNYQQLELGFNYRMTDIHGVLGLSQMQRLDEFIARRNEIAGRYNDLLADLPLRRQVIHADSYSSYHLYVVCLEVEEAGISQRQLYEQLRSVGILVNLHYIPVYRQPYYEKMGFKPGYCPQAEKYYTSTLSLPMYPALSDQQQDRVISELRSRLAK